MTNKERIIAVIPAHLNSVRLPGKVMLDIFNIPMIEQVRRRVKLSKHLDDVIVATNSVSVKKLIEKNNGKVIYTRRKHMNENAERINGWAAMIGVIAAMGSYATTGQIIPGIW